MINEEEDIVGASLVGILPQQLWPLIGVVGAEGSVDLGMPFLGWTSLYKHIIK